MESKPDDSGLNAHEFLSLGLGEQDRSNRILGNLWLMARRLKLDRGFGAALVAADFRGLGFRAYLGFSI